MSATATKATTGKSTSGSARRKPRTASKSASPTKRSTKTSAARADSEPAAATPPTKGTKTAAKAAKAPSGSKGSAATASRKATTAAKSSARAKPEAAAATKASAANKNAAGASTKGKAVGKAKAATAKTAAKSTTPVKAARPTTESKATATDAVKPDVQARANVKKAATAQPAKPSPKSKRTAARKRVAPRPEGFKNGNWVVHPSHGPGRVVGSERLSVGGETLELVTIAYGREMARLKIPVTRIQELGLRPISSKAQIQAATNTLKKPARISRTMWSRRAQDYESKLHSGDLVQIAEVLRDLYRAPDGPEQSFSERELYKDALDRFSREIAAAEKNLTEEKAAQRLESVLRRAT